MSGGTDVFGGAPESRVAAAGSLYADSGGNVSRCELCDEPLTDAEAWMRGMDGAGAHHSCLRAFGVRRPARDSRGVSA